MPIWLCTWDRPLSPFYRPDNQAGKTARDYDEPIHKGFLKMSAQSFRALVVDDEVIARTTVMFALRQEDFDCEAAVDGEDALAKLASNQFDLLVTDLRMPNKHGYALANELLDRQATPIIVVHSSIENPKLIKDLMARGIDDIIGKPTNYGWFAAKLKGLAIRRRIQRTQCPHMPGDFLRVSPEAIDVLMNANLKETKIKSITESVQRDPVLANELIRMANSVSRNPAQREIKSLGEAVSRLGTNQICEFITDQLSGFTEWSADHSHETGQTRINLVA